MKVRDINPTGIRLPPDMKKVLRHHAVENDRSLGAELLHRLKRTLAEDERREEASEK